MARQALLLKAATTYTVVAGDTLTAIAKRNGSSVKILQALNPQITDINLIYPGDIVNLACVPDDATFSSVGIHFDIAPLWGQALIRQFFAPVSWEAAACIVSCESGWNKDAHNVQGEDSRGLFQINVATGANPKYAGWNLYDPDVNFRAAREIFMAWGGWNAWSCAAKCGVRS